MPYQYKREPLSDYEVNRLTNAYETFDEKFVIWTLLDTGLRVSESGCNPLAKMELKFRRSIPNQG